ncbi:MAG: M1 family aminopeptidase [Chitinophagales bacterium]
MQKIVSLITILVLHSFCISAADRSDSLDVVHTKLALDFSDFNQQILHAWADITVQAKVNGISHLRLDLLKLQVDSVKQSSALSFHYNDTSLIIDLPTALNAGNQTTISIYYHGHPLQESGDFGGFYWTPAYAFNIGVSFLADPHNYGRVWFPCFDNFIDRCTFQFEVTTDTTRTAFCNGRLDSVTNGNGKRTWHWRMNDPIPSYLASVAVSDYCSLNDTIHAQNGIVPVLLAARAADTSNLKGSFVNLKKAFHLFEEKFGPYVFNRVGYCVVPFNAGAMEHATNISYMQGVVDGSTTYENLMAHELSHHWFGDMATCASAGEMWLNEGWARYCENIFYEAIGGRKRYLQEVRSLHETVIHLAHVEDNLYYAVSGVPTQLTYSTKTVYEKGADRVHTLRSYLGDSVFFHCVTAYLQQYKFIEVNSLNLRDFLVNCSGNNAINNFFADWIFDGGFPDFSIEDKSISENNGQFIVTLNIWQRLQHAHHYFQNVPLEISFFDSLGNREIRNVEVSGSCTQVKLSIGFWPQYIALDFDEKLSDAVTSEWKKIKATSGAIDFGTAHFLLYPQQGSDSSLIRVEHHWVAPDASGNIFPGLHLSDYRYWDVDGIWADDFRANAIFNYNGTTSNNGYLDNSLITNTEDSLVMLYRPDAQSNWNFADSVIWSRGNVHDKAGYARVYHLQKGQYAFGIYDASKADSSLAPRACFPLAINKQSVQTVKLYPNPVRNAELFMDWEIPSTFNKCFVMDLLGNVVLQQSIPSDTCNFMIQLNGLPTGNYVVGLNGRFAKYHSIISYQP